MVVVGLFLWFFGGALFSSRSFVFRDAAHYYYPLFEWSSREWSRGRVPLWNPQENCGVPAAADATSSVFYPGKLVFILPLDFASKYKLYIAGHVLLAAAAAYCLARQWQASRWAGGLCAVSYAFGGNVLFQYCNVVFLVGAAWLPLALLAAHRMLVARSFLWSLALAVLLSLMVLGGDAQAAYHAGLLSALYAVFLWRAERHRTKRDDELGDSPDVRQSDIGSHTRNGMWRKHRIVLLAVAAVGAMVLSAIQVLPSIEWTRQSGRAAFRSPRSVYEIPAHLARDNARDNNASIADGLLGVPARGTHHEHIYHFSVAPWRLAELVWPNFSGRLFPTNRRWTIAIPAEGRVWTPSLYMGLLPLVLALWCWRWRGDTAHVHFVSWLTLLAILAGFGWYGVGWLIHEFRCSLLGAEVDDALIGQPVGGLYWLLVTVLPGYTQFRYPAKLLVIASLGLSVLAARGLDRLFTTGPGRLRRVLGVLSCVSLVAMLATLAIGPQWNRWMNTRYDALFGPVDAAGALCDLRITFLHTTLLCLVMWCLLSRVRQSSRIKICSLLITVTAVDLAIANGWMIPTASTRHWQGDSYFANQILEHEGGNRSADTFRVFRGSARNWVPSTWATSGSPDRQQEGLKWDVDTLYPKYHLRTGLALVESSGTFSSQDYQTLLRVARRRGPKRPDGVSEPHAAVMDALAAKYILSPDDFQYPGTRQIDEQAGQALPPNAVLWLNEDYLPRAWIVHDIVTLPPLRHADPATIAHRTREVLFPNGQPRDLRNTCVVETDALSSPGQVGWAKSSRPTGEGAETRGQESEISDQRLEVSQSPVGREDLAHPTEITESESCAIVVDQPHRVEVMANLKRPGLLVLSDFYYPGWIAEVTNESDGRYTRAPILRTNRVMRGVYLQPGEQRVAFYYRPTTVYVGAILSIAGWIAVVVLAAGSAGRLTRSRRRWRTRPADDLSRCPPSPPASG